MQSDQPGRSSNRPPSEHSSNVAPPLAPPPRSAGSHAPRAPRVCRRADRHRPGILIFGPLLGLVGYGLGSALGAALDAVVGSRPRGGLELAGAAFGVTVGTMLGVDAGGGLGAYVLAYFRDTDRTALWSPVLRRVVRMGFGAAVGAISDFLAFGVLGGALVAVVGAALGSGLSVDVGS